MKSVVVVETSDMDIFEKHCASLIAEGYEISSTSCGFVHSERYDFCNSYQAIFVLPNSKGELRKLAGLTMQGLLASELTGNQSGVTTLAELSVGYAKALIRELEKEQ